MVTSVVNEKKPSVLQTIEEEKEEVVPKSGHRSLKITIEDSRREKSDSELLQGIKPEKRNAIAELFSIAEVNEEPPQV